MFVYFFFILFYYFLLGISPSHFTEQTSFILAKNPKDCSAVDFIGKLEEPFFSEDIQIVLDRIGSDELKERMNTVGMDPNRSGNVRSKEIDDQLEEVASLTDEQRTLIETLFNRDFEMLDYQTFQ